MTPTPVDPPPADSVEVALVAEPPPQFRRLGDRSVGDLLAAARRRMNRTTFAAAARRLATLVIGKKGHRFETVGTTVWAAVFGWWWMQVAVRDSSPTTRLLFTLSAVVTAAALTAIGVARRYIRMLEASVACNADWERIQADTARNRDEWMELQKLTASTRDAAMAAKDVAECRVIETTTAFVTYYNAWLFERNRQK